MNLPGKTGVAAGTKLAGGNAGDSPLKQKPTMDFEVDYGIRLNVSPTGTANGYLSYVDYTNGNPSAGATDTYQGSVDKTGATVTTASATSGPFQNWKTAYISSTSLAANTNNAGAEFQFNLASLGLTSAAAMNLFVAYVNDGGIFTSDTFPPIAGQTTALAADQDFTTISGRQYLTYQVGAGPLATRTADAAAIGLNVYPNPAAGTSSVAYQVTERAAPVNIALTDLLGRTVRVLESGVKSVGSQSALLNTSALAAGTYLVRVQVGDKVSTSKVAVL
jgi:hypothetical protein